MPSGTRAFCWIWLGDLILTADADLQREAACGEVERALEFVNVEACKKYEYDEPSLHELCPFEIVGNDPCLGGVLLIALCRYKYSCRHNCMLTCLPMLRSTCLTQPSGDTVDCVEPCLPCASVSVETLNHVLL